MCLLKPIVHVPRDEVFRLFKIFRIDSNGWFFPVLSEAVQDCYRLGHSYKACAEKWDNPGYPASFHGLLTRQKAQRLLKTIVNSGIFKTEPLAEDQTHTICLVKFNGVVHKESHWDYEIAATRMLIIEEVST